MSSAKLCVVLCLFALAFVHVHGQGYNPSHYPGWHGECTCANITHDSPSALCASSVLSQRDNPECSATECKNECKMDSDCNVGEFEVCCCEECGNRCQPGIAPPLPPADM